jgi:hypothetical protein
MLRADDRRLARGQRHQLVEALQHLYLPLPLVGRRHW